MDKVAVVYDLLKSIYFILEDGDRKLLSSYDLTIPRFYALKHIHDNPGISLSRLSKLMISDKGNMSRIVKGMENEGLILRKPNAQDGRALRLYLSDSGAALCDRVLTAHTDFNDLRFARLAAAPNGLVRELEEIKTSLESHLEHTTTVA